MFDNLFTPLTVNGTILKNRIVAAPTSDLFEEKAAGGAGMVIAGHAIVEPGRSSYASPAEPWLFSKYERETTHERVLKVHQAGARASIELFHAGATARTVDFAKGPCAYVREDGVEVRAMDEESMRETLDWYAQTASAARKIGFDAIFLHFGHGWLPAQFLSPLYNHRIDEYGGSLENRAKFPLRILETVRRAVGPRFPIDMRISASEWVPDSIDFADVLAFLKMAEKYLDMVQVSSGIDLNKVANVHCVTTNLEDEMVNLGWARQVKRAVDIPIGVVGAFLTADQADQAIARGDVDLVAFGRTLIADPDWPRKAEEGRPEDIMPCLRCSNCYHITSDHWNVGCSVNPRYHHEDFIPKSVGRAERPRRVVIVGAGPGGMRAAITASERGHEVTLIERDGELGGELRFIARESHKGEVVRLLDYYRTQVARHDIDVRLGTEATPELVASLEPDALVIAVGAREMVPPVEGIDNPKVLLATQAIESIDALGQHVVVLGGGSIGCEVALELAEKGRDVTVVERSGSLAANANSMYREALRQKFELHTNIHVALSASCTKVGDDVVSYEDATGTHEVAYDHMVVSTGLAPRIDLVESFFGICRNTTAIGDCTHPSSIMNATFEGHSFALSI